MPSRALSERLEWIRSHFESINPALARPDAEGSLTQLHGSCPKGVDPLEGLDPQIVSATSQQQLDNFAEVYGKAVLEGYGLTLNAMGTATTPKQKRIAALVKDKIGDAAESPLEKEDLDPQTVELLKEYEKSEARLHWACQQLNWPSEWVVEYLRERESEELAGPDPDQAPNNEPMPMMTPELALIDIPNAEQLLEATETERLAALNQAYGKDIKEALTLNELLSQALTDHVSERAANLAQEIKEQSEQSDESVHDILRVRYQSTASRQYQIRWAARALGLDDQQTLDSLFAIHREA